MLKEEETLKDIELEFSEKLSEATSNSEKLESESEIVETYKNLTTEFLGADSKLIKTLKGLKKIKDIEKKKLVGKKANQLRQKLETEISEKQKRSIQKLVDRSIKQEYVDPTSPGIGKSQDAHQHIVTQTIARIEDIFQSMGFEVEYAYEVDTAYNAFDTVNIPESHPARDNWDTLWLSDDNLAIPQTSAMQNRILSANSTPIRKIIIGKCFRNEATDATHEHTFYQVEGVYLDRNVTMADMIGVLVEFLKVFFNKEFNYKFTPDYFPFVEPGGQLAIERSVVTGKGGKDDYLEILGCGMIHPKVIEMAGKDSQKYNGFAWGFGIERIILLKYGIEDIRNFYSGDLRFINQF